MHLPIAADFWQEWERFGFRFCCEDCGHFDPDRDCCGHGWPSADHRRAAYRTRARRHVVFCKEFELR